MLRLVTKNFSELMEQSARRGVRYLQGVPHNIRSFIALNYDFRDLSEKTNHFQKIHKANTKKNLTENTRVFQ